MRARLFALGILIVLIGVPTFGYWYFTEKNTSSLSLSVIPKRAFHVILDGTFSFSFFPLADKILHFEFDCSDSCVLSPLPPLAYKLQIISSGAVTLDDTLSLEGKIQTKKSYTLVPELSLTEIPRVSDISLANALIENARTNLGDALSLVGIGKNGRVYAVTEQQNNKRIGILTSERFTPFYEVPLGLIPTLDVSGEYFLFASPTQKNTTIVRVDGAYSQEIPLSDVVAVAELEPNLLKIRTKTSVFTFDGQNLIENPRFTDFVDLSPTLRLGYIDKNDRQKLALGNFGTDVSVLVLLDRSTGTSTLLRKDISLETLFLKDDTPVFLDANGKIFSLNFSSL